MPAHFDGEAYAAFRRAQRRGIAAAAEVEAWIRMLVRLPVKRVPLYVLLLETHALGPRFSPADAFYVALARRLHAELLTCDASLAAACAGIAAVRVIASRG